MKFQIVALYLSLVNVQSVPNHVVAEKRKKLREIRNLQRTSSVMTDVSEYISKQYKGDCNKFFAAFDTNEDQVLDQMEVELLAARISLFALLNGLSSTKSSEASKAIYDQCGNAPCPPTIFCGGVNPKDSGARMTNTTPVNDAQTNKEVAFGGSVKGGEFRP